MLVMEGSRHSKIFMTVSLLEQCIILKWIQVPLVFPKHWVVSFQTILH